MRMDWDSDSVNIKTCSVEKALIPLIAQISIIVNSNIKKVIDQTSRKILDSALPNLELSVCKFSDIGHEIGNSDTDIRDEMLEACDIASRACNKFVTELINHENFNKSTLTESSRMLLSSITRILLLADRIAIKRLVNSIEKVDKRLLELENVKNFTEFVYKFSQFGSDMVELANISGERQNDLKDDLQRAEVCASRSVLEKSTMMLLTTCKACLRHPESELANGNRKSVFKNMRQSMDILKLIIRDNVAPNSNVSHGITLDFLDVMDLIEKVPSNPSEAVQFIEQLSEALDNITIDMESVINVGQINPTKKLNMKSYINKTKELDKNLRACLKGKKDTIPNSMKHLKEILPNILTILQDLKFELTAATKEQVVQLSKIFEYKNSLRQLKAAALAENNASLDAEIKILDTEFQKLQEVSNLVKNICSNRPCILTASRLEENLVNLLPQMRDAAKMLAAQPQSKITQENLEVFIDVFETQVEELCNLLRNITESINNNSCGKSSSRPISAEM
ncbi:alpha-catulin isoform X1 [Hydra vulgaris]|uniref:alpha-catulin isoform X1 n=1 Tax=Hydra vulgaris TaxID=6087 RepID=UPI001F5FE6A1|nr:alpha-catulin-like [Hydra vulgaris]